MRMDIFKNIARALGFERVVEFGRTELENMQRYVLFWCSAIDS